jgi:predicted site-specific integrase-resolvase
MNLPPRFVAPGIAAALLGVHRSTLIRYEKDGRLKPRRLHGTGHRRYLLSDLRECLQTPISDATLLEEADRLEAA